MDFPPAAHACTRFEVVKQSLNWQGSRRYSLILFHQPYLRKSDRSTGHHRHVPVHVLVEQIAERPWATGVAGLRAECAQPHEIPGLDLDPVLVQPVDRLALQHVKPVFHHMGFGKGDHAAWLKGDDIDEHVMA